MKTKQIILLLGLFIPTLINAQQLPEKTEDISPLLNGETVPNAMLTSPDGKKFQLKEIVGQKPTVLLFYRGGWCPFCNAHLLEIQGVQNQVVNLGYQIIAISPDSPQNLIATDEKQDLAYSLYSDAEGKLIKAMGLAFKAPERYSGMLLEKSGGLNPGFLPVPAVFVLDTSGKILFEYINPDYKTRLKADMLMAVLKSIQNK